LGGGFNQSQENLFGTYYTTGHYKALGWFWVQRQTESKWKYSLIAIVDGYQQSDSSEKIINRYTYGGNLNYSSDGIFLNSTFYYQSGQTLSKQTISAYMFSINPGYKWGKIGLGIGLDFLSGNNEMNGADNFYTGFNTLYATNHKFYGTMDHFLNVPSDSKNGGLIDTYFKAKYKIGEKAILRLDYHYFRLQNAIPSIADSKKDLERSLGSEIDISYSLKVSEFVSLQVGYSMLFAERSLEALKGGVNNSPATWAWLMLSAKPVFFSTKKK